MTKEFEHEEIPESPLERANTELRLARKAYSEDPGNTWERLIEAIDSLLPLVDQPTDGFRAGSPGELRQEREEVFKGRPLTLKTWENYPNPPPREWIVEEWLPANRVTLFWGIAGAGKSHLSVQLAAGVASGGGNENRWIKSPSGLLG